MGKIYLLEDFRIKREIKKRTTTISTKRSADIGRFFRELLELAHRGGKPLDINNKITKL